MPTRDPNRHRLQRHASDRFLTLSGLTDDETAAAIITLHPREDCAEFSEMTLDAVGVVQPRKQEDGDV